MQMARAIRSRLTGPWRRGHPRSEFGRQAHPARSLTATLLAVALGLPGLMLVSGLTGIPTASAAVSASQQWITSGSTATSQGVGGTMTVAFGTSGVTGTATRTGGNEPTPNWRSSAFPANPTNVATFLEPDPPASAVGILQGVCC